MTASQSTLVGQSISRLYGDFIKDLNELWELHCALRSYLPSVETAVAAGRVPPLEMAPFSQPTNSQVKSVSTTLGILQRGVVRDGSRTLVDASSRFEVFMASVTRLVYLHFGADRVATAEGASDSQMSRVIEWIFDSADRDEIIDRVIEDRIRSLSYGSGAELLKKDRAKLGIKAHFETGHEAVLDRYSEVLARRNLVVHSAGRVDRAYLHRHPNAGLLHRARVPVSEEYLAEALTVLRQLATCVAWVTGSAVAGRALRGELARRYQAAHSQP